MGSRSNTFDISNFILMSVKIHLIAKTIKDVPKEDDEMEKDRGLPPLPIGPLGIQPPSSLATKEDVPPPPLEEKEEMHVPPPTIEKEIQL